MFRHGRLWVDGIALHVVEAGETRARPILFLHGWPQSWIEWQEVMTLAANEFRAIAIDLPGIGESTPPGTNGSKRVLAAVAHGLIEQLDLEGAILVGHDIGGMVAYAYLRRYQDVAAVVIVDTVIQEWTRWDEVIHNPHIWHFAHSIPRLPELLVQGHQAPYLDYFFDVLTASPARITPYVRAAYARAYASEEALTAGFDFYRAFLQDVSDNLSGASGETETPVLYLRGAGSRGDLESYAGGLRSAGVTKLTAKQISDAAHFIPEEQPAELWGAIQGFLATPVDA